MLLSRAEATRKNDNKAICNSPMLGQSRGGMEGKGREGSNGEYMSEGERGNKSKQMQRAY